MSVATVRDSISSTGLGALDRSLCWQITARCNLACPFCLSRCVEPRSELSTDDAVRAIGLAASAGFRKLTFSGGEPLLRPDLKDLIQHVLDLGLGCCLSTNGMLLTDDLLCFLTGTQVRLRVSLDGPRDIHCSIRESNTYDIATQAVRRAVAAGVVTEINTVLTPMLLDRLAEFLDLARSLQVTRVNFFTFIERTGHLTCTGLEVSDQQVHDSRFLIEKYLTHHDVPFTARINDYRAADRHKLVVEPDGDLVGYSNTSLNDCHHGNILVEGALLDAIAFSAPQDAVELAR